MRYTVHLYLCSTQVEVTTTYDGAFEGSESVSAETVWISVLVTSELGLKEAIKMVFFYTGARMGNNTVCDENNSSDDRIYTVAYTVQCLIICTFYFQKNEIFGHPVRNYDAAGDISRNLS